LHVVSYQHHCVVFSVGTVKLIKDFSDVHACVPANKGWNIGDLELASNVFVDHAEACPHDVLVQYVVVLHPYKDCIDGLDLCR
jgi:hypothetical protein